MKVHHVKSRSHLFAGFSNGTRTFDLRLNDRDYQVGDAIVFEEWRHELVTSDEQRFTGKKEVRVISAIDPILNIPGVLDAMPISDNSNPFGRIKKYVILSLRLVTEMDACRMFSESK